MLIENEWKIDEISLDGEFTSRSLRLERQLFTQTFSVPFRLAKKTLPEPISSMTDRRLVIECISRMFREATWWLNQSSGWLCAAERCLMMNNRFAAFRELQRVHGVHYMRESPIFMQIAL
jgi:hypothetical protein